MGARRKAHRINRIAESSQDGRNLTSSERKDRMIGIPDWLRFGTAAIALAAASYGAAPARAADIIADWPTIQMPPPPVLKPATLDPKTTALFLFDSRTRTATSVRAASKRSQSSRA